MVYILLLFSALINVLLLSQLWLASRKYRVSSEHVNSVTVIVVTALCYGLMIFIMDVDLFSDWGIVMFDIMSYLMLGCDV